MNEIRLNYEAFLAKIHSVYPSKEAFARVLGIPSERLDAILDNKDDFTLTEIEQVQSLLYLTNQELKECLFTPA